MPMLPGAFAAVNSLTKMLSPVSRRERPPRILVFISMFVSIVAIAEASTFTVWFAGTCTVRKAKSGRPSIK